MSLSTVRCLALALVVACGGSKPTADEPQTAREKQLLEAKRTGEIDDPKAGKNWGTWSYTGDTENCFYVISRKCFKTKKAACGTLACEKKKKKCKAVGGGPATVSCK